MINYNEFQLIQLEVNDTRTQCKVKWKEEHSFSTIDYITEHERKFPLFLNDQVIENLDKLNDFVPIKSDSVQVVKLRIWEFANEMSDISLGYELPLKIKSATVTKKQRTTLTKSKKLPILGAWEDRVDELMGILESIKLNMYQFLIKGQLFTESRKEVEIKSESNSVTF